MTKEEILLANQEFLFPSVFHYFKEPLVISRAKDQYVWDADPPPAVERHSDGYNHSQQLSGARDRQQRGGEHRWNLNR